jgi:hypothetical protein
MRRQAGPQRQMPCAMRARHQAPAGVSRPHGHRPNPSRPPSRPVRVRLALHRAPARLMDSCRSLTWSSHDTPRLVQAGLRFDSSPRRGALPGSMVLGRRITTIPGPGPKLRLGPTRRHPPKPAAGPNTGVGPKQTVGPKLALDPKRRRAIPDATRSGPMGRRPSAPAGQLNLAGRFLSRLGCHLAWRKPPSR